MEMYEILVPTKSNEGKPFRTRYHKVWDKKVRKITGGLTINLPVKGEWVDETGRLFAERMIPVRIMCTSLQICQIAEMTAEYYDQKAVLYYLISNKATIYYPKSK